MYDLIIIGGGPAGYTAAFEAARSGLNTALVEKGTLGGTCLHSGCIPTKTLLHTAELYREVKNGAPVGLEADGLRVNMSTLQAYKNEVIAKLTDGIRSQLSRAKVTLIEGTARVAGSGRVEVQKADGSSEILEAKNILIACGSEPSRIPVEGLDLPGVMNSTAMLDCGTIPGRLVIIGGGVIGMEFAALYSSLGTQVTVIEALPRILSNLDKDFAQNLKLILKKQGVEIHTSASLKKVEQRDGALVCHYEEKDATREAAGDLVLVAVGRRPATKDLFSEEAGIRTERGRILVNETYETNLPGVYAAGDAIGGIQLAHVAEAEAINAVAAICGKPAPIRTDTVPSCVYTSPEIASVGITADEAKQAGQKVKVHRYVMAANGKTVLTRQERSFLKVITDEETGKIVGAQMMCARATDMIGELADCINEGRTLDSLVKTIRPHPTFNESLWELAKNERA